MPQVPDGQTHDEIVFGQFGFLDPQAAQQVRLGLLIFPQVVVADGKSVQDHAHIEVLFAVSAADQLERAFVEGHGIVVLAVLEQAFCLVEG